MTTAGDPPKFSMIIPARNEEEFIERCVRACLENEYPADRIEVIVADGFSDDRTREIVARLAEEDPRVRMLDNPMRISPTGVNIGIRNAKGDVIVFLSGHAVVSRNYMAELARVLREHPDVWRAGGAVETVSLTFTGKVISAAMSSPVGVGAGNWRLGTQEGYVPQTCFSAVPRWVFDKVGLYDEELVRNQDDEFVQRVHEAGGKEYMTQSVRVQYFSRTSPAKLARQYYQYGFWRLRTIQKRKRPAHLRQILPILFVAAWFPLALLAVAGAIWWWPLALPLAVYGGGYLLGLIGNVFWVARRFGWRVALLTPLACATIHFGYGWGGLVGVVHWGLFKGRFVPKPEAHSMSR
jgi:glycosyltransferase involved in cell wall biosynthesis